MNLPVLKVLWNSTIHRFFMNCYYWFQLRSLIFDTWPHCNLLLLAEAQRFLKTRIIADIWFLNCWTKGRHILGPRYSGHLFILGSVGVLQKYIRPTIPGGNWKLWERQNLADPLQKQPANPAEKQHQKQRPGLLSFCLGGWQFVKKIFIEGVT